MGDLTTILECTGSQSWTAFYERGLIYYHDISYRNINSALNDFKHAIEKNSLETGCIHYIGDCYSEFNELWEDALDYFTSSMRSISYNIKNKAIAKRPLAMTYFQRGRMYALLGKLKLASADFSAGLDLTPSSALGHLYMGSLYSMSGSLYDENLALINMNRALELDPFLFDTLVHRAKILEGAAAIRDLRAALAIHPHVISIRLQIAILYMRQFKDFRKGLLECKRILAVAPDTNRALHLRARAFARNGKDQ